MTKTDAETVAKISDAELQMWIIPGTSHGVHINSKTLGAIATAALDARAEAAVLRDEVARLTTARGAAGVLLDWWTDLENDDPAEICVSKHIINTGLSERDVDTFEGLLRAVATTGEAE